MSRRVVIAEDEAIIRLDLKEILQDEGYDVVGETGRGDEAVELVRAHRPDLAILDVKMPGADGLAAARAIRDLGEKVAVLILTAFSQRNLIDEAREAGVAAYLVKPFQRIELVPAIDQAMARCEQEWAIDAEAEAVRPRGRRTPGASTPRTSSRPGGWSTAPRSSSWSATACRGRRLRVHPADGHGHPLPDDRRGPPGPRGHARPVAGGDAMAEPTAADGGPLILLDGMSLAFRAYFALPPDLTTSTGVVTNAVHGFASMLRQPGARPPAGRRWPWPSTCPGAHLPRRDASTTTRAAGPRRPPTCRRSST